MKIELTIKNYRCFPDSSPASITLQEGFTSFIGVNNSGKSSILKFFYEFRNLFQNAANFNYFSHAMRISRVFNFPPQVYDPFEVFNNTNERDLIIELSVQHADSVDLSKKNDIKLTINVPRGTNTCTFALEVNGMSIAPDPLREVGSEWVLQLSPQLVITSLQEAFIDLANTLYIGPFRNTINEGSKENYYDLRIGESFIKEWRSIKEGTSKRQKEAALRLEEELRKIFEFEALQINPADDNKTLAISVNTKSYMLPELGAGIAQFIQVITSVAIRKPKYVLIDEPELHLHASLQLDFLTTLASYAPAGGVIFSTHNIGLARESSDRIYSVKKISPGVSEVKRVTDFIAMPEFLGELSYSGYKEMGLDKILLVEGTHDVRVFQQFLRLYGTEHTIVIVPMGGRGLISSSTLEELKEISRLSPHIFAVIDSEKDSETAPLAPERQAFVDNCKEVGIRCHVLDRRATENYFTDRVIKELKGAKYRELLAYEKLNTVNPSWGKVENWLLARKMTNSELEHSDLGEFLKLLS